jgi:hypothetical protein
LSAALTIASDLSTRLEGGLTFSSAGTLSVPSNVNLVFQRSSTYRWGIGQEFIATSSTAFIGWSSSPTDIGGVSAPSVDTKLFREAAGVLSVRGSSTSVGGAIGLIEQTAPAAPAANGVRIYAEDNGSGKTRLMALFATGVAQQIAIEP